jgi:hypothetical protein
MGRYSTGAITTGEALRLEINCLFKDGYIEKGCVVSASISWTSGANIIIRTDFTNPQPFITLNYTHTGRDGVKQSINYVVNIEGVPSNLGSGLNYYFVCPFTGKRAKILYSCYGSPYFKSRGAYKNRIYYRPQISSKLNYHNDRYWQLDKEIDKLQKQRRKEVYKGKKTRLTNRIERLKKQRDGFDTIRWGMMPKALLKQLGGRKFEV